MSHSLKLAAILAGVLGGGDVFGAQIWILLLQGKNSTTKLERR